MTSTTTDRAAQDSVTTGADLLAAFEAFTAASRGLEGAYAALAGRLGALLEALPGGVLLLDAAGRVQEANAAALALLGEPLCGESWDRVRARAFAGADPDQGEIALAGGRRVALAQKPLQPGAGRVLLLTDVTEARRIEDLLARHRRLATMGEMAAALAHQVRTPLAAALLYADNARRADLPAGQRDRQLDKAIACLHDLERLIGDMLGFARGASFAERRFDVAEILDAVGNALEPIVAPGQSLVVTPPAGAVPISGNREALAGAIINLATNALHAAGPSGRIEIRARAAGLQAEIVVADDGPGIPGPDRERIFDPFFTSRPDGTGLGLAVARSVARAHRGELSLVDATPGRTTFALRLPLAQGATDHHHHDRDAAA